MEDFLNPTAGECREHEHSIPTSSFDPPHLPYRCRSLMVWSLILHKARLTVKLFVTFVSPDRPAEFRGGNSVRGKGSGYVTVIDKIRSDPDYVKIIIDTAAHVVFDEEEAANTIAKFYFCWEKELFQLKGPAKLFDVNYRKDICRIVYTTDKETIQFLTSVNVLPALEYALSPSVLPDVNNNMNISLLQTVVARYQTRSFPLLWFLFQEIRCLKNITFISNKTRVLEIETDISLILLYDVILLIIALKTHHDDIMNLMEDIVTNSNVNWNEIHMDTVQRPFIRLSKEEQNNCGHIDKSTSYWSLNKFIEMDKEQKCIVNSDFSIQQNEVLFTLMNCLITSPFKIANINRALTDVCQFDISARLNKSGKLVFEIPETSVRVPGNMSLEVNLHDVRIEEDDHTAVLISHPDDMPPQITVGKLERRYSRRIKYTTPSYPGSSGGPVWIIHTEGTSQGDIENIDVFTHSHRFVNVKNGVGHRL